MTEPTREEIEMLFIAELQDTPMTEFGKDYIPNWMEKHNVPQTFSNTMFVGRLYMKYVVTEIKELFKI